MRVNKKQLLGFGGLAFVVGLTTVAYNLPTNATSAGGAVEVTVEVYNINLETVIDSPLDGAILTDEKVTFSESHSNANNVKYYLTYVAEDGTKTEYELEDYEFVAASDESGKTSFELNLNEYGGSGKYIFRSVAKNSDGHEKEDAVQFIYAAINAEQDDVKSTTEKVDFAVDYSAGVKSLTYQIVDKAGKAISKVFMTATADPENGGTQNISIDLTGEEFANLASGRYTLIIKGYSTVTPADDSLVGTSTVFFDYEAPEEEINVPDTGSLLSALNISKSDFLITGLIGFSLISLAALFVIRKSHKK